MKNKTKPRGFTLIEILVTMVIVAIVLMGLTPMMMASIKGTGSSKRRAEATNFGQAAIEYYKNHLYVEDTFNLYVDDYAKTGNTITDVINTGAYNFVRIMTFDSTGLGEDLLRISTEVQWLRSLNSTDSNHVNLSTVIRRRIE